MMRRLWLTFAQAVTIAVAVVFVVATFKPAWLPGNTATVIAVQDTVTAPVATPAASPGSYANAAQAALPSVVHIFTSKEIRT